MFSHANRGENYLDKNRKSNQSEPYKDIDLDYS